MKLFVDDEREAPDGWTVVRTITDAIRAIDQFLPEEISLDHDCGSETECFCPVAYYIRARYETLPKITVHSSNPDGAKALRDLLTP